jgi:hypothetical protein
MLLLFAGCSGYFSRSIPATGAAEQETTRRIVFHVVDAEGKRIDWARFVSSRRTALEAIATMRCWIRRR